MTIRGKSDQLRCVFAGGVGIPVGPARVDVHVAAVGPAQLRQTLQERSDAGLCLWIVRGPVHEHANAPHLVGLLRTRGDRPCSRLAAK